MVSKFIKYSIYLWMVAGANSIFAQHNEVVERIAEPGSYESVYKRYYVLADAADVQDGFYREISEKDILLLEGTYANGRKTGKWLRFFNNESEQIKETLEFFDEKFEAEQIAYSNTGNTLETGKFKCDSKGNLLFKIGEWRYFKQNELLEKVENFDAGGNKNGDQIFYDAKGKVDKIEIYSANSLVKTKDKFDFQKEQLLDFNSKLENAKPDFSNIYKAEVAPILKEAKTFGKLEKSETNFLTGERILEKMQTVHAALMRFTDEEKVLTEQYLAVRDKYINAYSPIFLTEIKRIMDIDIPEYKRLESITERTVKGLSLITKLNEFNVQFGKLRTMDSQIEKLANIT
ncbi:MAG TPA: hypothetical protein DCQ31_13695, partial [Bacteroidales bacterium]|nr:hypothetical protein [Bacteroidales bacterium]